MDTNTLINRLAGSAKPLRPLPNPWIRAAIWLTLSLPYVALVIFVVSPRSDLPEKLAETRFLVEQFAALATGITAAVAAFATIIPGYSRKYLLLPVLPLAFWLGSLGVGCALDFAHVGLHNTELHADWFCLPGIVLVGAVPGVAIVLMLQRGAPLSPSLSTALAGLAAAGLGDFGLRMFHPEDAGLLVLIWQFGTVFVLAMLAGWAGRYVLNWRSLIGSRGEKLAS